MRDIIPLSHLLLGGFARVALVHAEVLGPAFRQLKPWDHDGVQRLNVSIFHRGRNITHSERLALKPNEFRAPDAVSLTVKGKTAGDVKNYIETGGVFINHARNL